jgi:S1-C subfamily serine protease
MLKRRHFVLLLATPWALPALAEAPAGRLGFAVNVEVEGPFWKPVLQTARVTKVNPGSAAEAGGLKVDDLILALDGRAVQGAPARELAATMSAVRAGQTLQLRVRRGSEELPLTLVARAAP